VLRHGSVGALTRELRALQGAWAMPRSSRMLEKTAEHDVTQKLRVRADEGHTRPLDLQTGNPVSSVPCRHRTRVA
jgi:hypothetical protein